MAPFEGGRWHLRLEFIGDCLPKQEQWHRQSALVASMVIHRLTHVCLAAHRHCASPSQEHSATHAPLRPNWLPLLRERSCEDACLGTRLPACVPELSS
jgi:hypothetical protein